MDSRLKEMTAVLKKYKLTHGLTPEKFRLILQELGPTYIKLGQIMSLHSDILPKEYCEELMKLCSDVEPMPFEQVEAVIDASFGYSWKDVFASIDKKPLGAASIAQVHRATLKTGEQVVVKVQRKGIHEVMSKDMALLHKAVKLVPPISIKGIVDFDMVLDEMWAVAQEEMNFLLEASNIEEFAGNNRDVAFVATPKLYRKYTTSHVLVMEYIKGFNIDDKEGLLKDGYDLEEIGSKLIDNYIRQVIEDGFFHADPHPGNVKIRDGKIVWIDMGMMGRLSEHDKKELSNAVYGIAMNDIGMIEDAVLAIGDFKGEPDRAKLYKDIKIIMNKYGSLIPTGYAMIIGGVVLGIIGRVWNISASLDIYGYLAMAGIIVIGTVLAFSMYLIGVNLIGPMRASLIAAVEPLSATICMCLWLHSPFTLMDVLGFIMVMSTIFILSYKKKAS